MKLSSNETKCLRDYIAKNDVVYQRYDELIEVSNEEESENRKSLLKDLDAASTIEIYYKGHQFVCDDFHDLNNWCKEDDVLLLIETIGTLICIPREIASEYHIISKIA